MRKLLVWSAAMLVVSAPSIAYANNGHGHGGGGGTPAFTLSVPASAAVDQSGVQSVSVTVTRVASSAVNLKNCSSTVTVATSPNTDSGAGAVAGTDYATPTETATIAKGQTFTTFLVQLIHETANAPDADDTESFNVTISNPTSNCKSKAGIVNPSAATEVVTISDGRTTFHVPAGDEVQLSAMSLGGCDSLYAYLFRTVGDPILLGSQADLSPCAGSTTPSDTSWTNDTGDDVVVAIGVTDVNCDFPDGVTYFSDTTSSVLGDTTLNHARVTPVSENVWTVDVTDTGGGCPSPNDWRIPAAGQGSFSGTLRIVTAAPDAPTNFSASANGSFEIDLAWDAMATAESYDVYKGDSGSEVFLDNTTNNTYEDTDSIVVGTEYCYYVIAKNGVGSSTQSSEQCATISS